MEFVEKIDKLKLLINDSLIPLINNDYVLWDLPYHGNIGDTLIWQGELDFLKEVKYECLDYASKDTCSFPELSKNTVILLHGGGNFGDLWRWFQSFRLKVIEYYPENRIIIFPQTVYYEDKELMKADATLMAKHQHLTICARDQISYKCLKINFQNEVLLLPDMAFCISLPYLKRWWKKENDQILYLKRTDKELAEDSAYLTGAEARDWPSLENRTWRLFLFEKGLGLNRYLKKYKLLLFWKWWGEILDIYGVYIFRPGLVRMGVRFLSSYHYIYTTRLHVVILSILLEKKCEFFDNSYGKNSAFYDTWLKDLPLVKRAEKNF